MYVKKAFGELGAFYVEATGVRYRRRPELESITTFQNYKICEEACIADTTCLGYSVNADGTCTLADTTDHQFREPEPGALIVSRIPSDGLRYPEWPFTAASPRIPRVFDPLCDQVYPSEYVAEAAADDHWIAARGADGKPAWVRPGDASRWAHMNAYRGSVDFSPACSRQRENVYARAVKSDRELVWLPTDGVHMRSAEAWAERVAGQAAVLPDTGDHEGQEGQEGQEGADAHELPVLPVGVEMADTAPPKAKQFVVKTYSALSGMGSR